MKLEDIGFYTLCNERAIKRAEIISIEKAITIEELAMAMGVKLT